MNSPSLPRSVDLSEYPNIITSQRIFLYSMIKGDSTILKSGLNCRKEVRQFKLKRVLNLYLQYGVLNSRLTLLKRWLNHCNRLNNQESRNPRLNPNHQSFHSKLTLQGIPQTPKAQAATRKAQASLLEDQTKPSIRSCTTWKAIRKPIPPRGSKPSIRSVIPNPKGRSPIIQFSTWHLSLFGFCTCHLALFLYPKGRSAMPSFNSLPEILFWTPTPKLNSWKYCFEPISYLYPFNWVEAILQSTSIPSLNSYANPILWIPFNPLLSVSEF